MVGWLVCCVMMFCVSRKINSLTTKCCTNDRIIDNNVSQFPFRLEFLIEFSFNANQRHAQINMFVQNKQRMLRGGGFHSYLFFSLKAKVQRKKTHNR